MTSFQKMLKDELKSNNGKISPEFIDRMVSLSEVIYLHPTDNTRICILKLPTGHEVIGVAQVLDAKNDIEEIGNKIAYTNAKNQLWSAFGSIAKVL